jgi:molybdopterin synthase catalytic subunit
MADDARLKAGPTREPVRSTAATPLPLVAVTSEPLDLPALIAAVSEDAAGDGAVASFIGLVRDHNQGRRVSFLEYEAYEPLAVRALNLIVDESRSSWPTARLAVHHRIGRLDIGEASIIIAAASPHRGEAFAACRYTIERVKQIVPIWKHEHFEGGDVWLEGAIADPGDEAAREQARRAAGPERSGGACA